MNMGPISFPNGEFEEELLVELSNNSHYLPPMVDRPRDQSWLIMENENPVARPTGMVKPGKELTRYGERVGRAVEKADHALEQTKKLSRLEKDLATAETHIKMLARQAERQQERELDRWRMMSRDPSHYHDIFDYVDRSPRRVEHVTERVIEHHERASIAERRSLAMMRFCIVYTTIMSLAAVATLAYGLWPASVVASMTSLMGFFMIMKEAKRNDE